MERPKYYKEAWYFQLSQNHKALETQLEENKPYSCDWA